MDAAQGTERELLHVGFFLHELLANLAFHVCSHLLVGIEMRRIGRQVEQLEHAVEAVDIITEEFGLVDRMTVRLLAELIQSD